jgi:hypothetical protein
MPATNNAFTDLALAGVGVAPYSARGLLQQLTPIQQAAQARRTVNGNLRDVSMTQFQKYASVITGSDQEPPVCDGVWPGRIVVVNCISELVRPNAQAASRPVVTGSEVVGPVFTTYRPVLTMMVMNLDVTRDEYGAQVSWTLNLEEV